MPSPSFKALPVTKFVSALLTASLLAACGGGASNPVATANNPSSTNSARAAFKEILEDIAGNANGVAVTYRQLNSIPGINGAIAGVDYGFAFSQASFVNTVQPTQQEIQQVIDRANQSHDAGSGESTETPAPTPTPSPTPVPVNHAPAISGAPARTVFVEQSYVFTPLANDIDQNDKLVFSIQNKPGWARFDTQSGKLSGTPTQQGIFSHIIISVSDGALSSKLPAFDITVSLSPEAQAQKKLEQALTTGDASGLKTEDLLHEARLEIARLKTGESLLKTLYRDEKINFDPGNRTQIFSLKGDAHQVYPILHGNKSKILALAGQKEKSRFAAFGEAPMVYFQKNENISYEPQFKRLLAWLFAGGQPDQATLASSKTIALSFTRADKHKIKDWLAANYANWTLKDCEDPATLANCYAGVDLVISGWQADNADTDAIKQVFTGLSSKGTPVLYLHTWYEATNDVAYAIADVFGFSPIYGGNYWAKDAASWNNVQQMQAAVFAGLGYQSIDTVLAHFQAQDYSFDWSLCQKGKGNDSDQGSDYDQCDAVSGLQTEFLAGANALRKLTTNLDKNKIRMFQLKDSYRIQKLLVLLADKYRQGVHYPMDKALTGDNAFMQSYFADSGVFNYRKINPAQADMGNFSRSDFSHITPTSRLLKLISKRNFRSTGAYAIPGKTVKITRKDSSNVTVKVFINTLRPGATHHFEKEGYKRPKYLQTPHFEITRGETLELTSPYGGPLQLSFGTNDQPVEVLFENIGEHPYWASPADDESFKAKLNAGDFDWAEVVTSGFEVHSKLEKMRESVADPKWGTPEALANATKRYMSNLPHVLAGFQGPGIDKVAEIHGFANTHHLTIETLDTVKHMNADQATCGYGCSGNPYDAYWAYSPTGHGDLHELGHGLEKGRMRFAGWEIHSTTNPYSYYSKSHYFEDTGGDPGCQKLPFEQVFKKLQSSINKTDPAAYLKDNLWKTSGWSQQFMVMLQAMMHAQKMGKLQNGWHLLARLHILERELKRAKADWDNKKTDIGFSQYSKAEIDSIDNNDWMLVSLSYAAGLDYRDYLNMMGIKYSQKAADQVSSFNYPLVAKSYFASTPNGYCKVDAYGSMLDKTPVLIDGVGVWPAEDSL